MDEGKLGLINIDLYIRFALICGTFIAGFYCTLITIVKTVVMIEIWICIIVVVVGLFKSSSDSTSISHDGSPGFG